MYASIGERRAVAFAIRDWATTNRLVPTGLRLLVHDDYGIGSDGTFHIGAGVVKHGGSEAQTGDWRYGAGGWHLMIRSGRRASIALLLDLDNWSERVTVDAPDGFGWLDAWTRAIAENLIALRAEYDCRSVLTMKAKRIA